ncbi:ATP-binding cassette domain-containing protein [Sinosporangium siamense]|uniref:Daunorubicin resistance protein DrrA family ABC transporter ATP-binding protein n=1 Tax=Sinosporangium siamense TaxID=1367973 RepID=A0A919RGG7_9ACTN|nr:ATP-binding cassette domain-containing protein [Sinosporangium siamense]GII91374.1 daunorubicin resistance protein DrrA family ABC transporter ATP-binding protein [Sinosporangium siamense]
MIIDTHDLKKTFTTRKRRGAPETVHAVRGIDLTVKKGEIFGVLGPNGAGKTTTIRMLATLLTPDAGGGTVAGHDLVGEPGQVRRKLGYVGQAGGVNDYSSPRTQTMLAARIHGMSKAEAARRTEEIFAALGIAELADRQGRSLSGGQKRRVALALGLVHRPPLLFLDEPTTGLDPQNRANLWDQIRGLREEGTSVVLTTHYLDEADALCDRLAIVDHGVVVAEGTPSELKQRVAGDVVTLRLSAPGAADVLRSAHCVREVREDGDTLRVYVDDGEHTLPVLLRLLEEHGLTLQSLGMQHASLDDVFLTQTGRSLRDAS